MRRLEFVQAWLETSKSTIIFALFETSPSLEIGLKNNGLCRVHIDQNSRNGFDISQLMLQGYILFKNDTRKWLDFTSSDTISVELSGQTQLWLMTLESKV